MPRALMLSDVSVVLRRSVSASARPPPSPRPFQSRWSNVRAVQAQCLYPPSTCSDVRSRQETCYVLRQPDGSCRPKAAVFEAQQDSHLTTRSSRSNLSRSLLEVLQLPLWRGAGVDGLLAVTRRRPASLQIPPHTHILTADDE